MNKTGAIVNIAWPETKVFKASSWYDGVMKVTGHCKNDYYKVGHAALLLIDFRTSDVFYFDFGRYHAPQGYGRVRDVESDPEMKIWTKATIENNEVTNLVDILVELQKNESTHGDGRLVASITNNIDFDKAYSYSKSLQSRGAVPYGPFQINGSNCSRFVAETYKRGVNTFFKKNRINLSYIFFHTPISNILTTYTGDNIYTIGTDFTQMQESTLSIFANRYRSEIRNTPSTNNLKNIPRAAFCLRGTGCNTWFQLEKTKRKHIFNVKRWSETGHLEIDAEYSLLKLGFDINKPYKFTYISNGIAVKIIQNGEVFELQNASIKGFDKSTIRLNRPRRFQLKKVIFKRR